MQKKSFGIATAVGLAPVIAGFIAFWWAYSTDTTSGKFDLTHGWSTLTAKTGGSMLIIVLVIAAIVSFVLVVASNQSKEDKTAIFAISLLTLIGAIVWLSILIGDLSKEDKNALGPITGLFAILALIGVGSSAATFKTINRK